MAINCESGKEPDTPFNKRKSWLVPGNLSLATAYSPSESPGTCLRINRRINTKIRIPNQPSG